MRPTAEFHHFSSSAGAIPLPMVESISTFRRYYPDINHWFIEKVVPGLADGSRRIFVGGSSSFLIAKKRAHERKVCTLWVSPDERRKGIASQLLLDAYEWLETKYPLITVPDEKDAEFRALLNKHNFRQTERLDDYYRSGHYERVFNGWLSNSLSRPNFSV